MMLIVATLQLTIIITTFQLPEKKHKKANGYPGNDPSLHQDLYQESRHPHPRGEAHSETSYMPTLHHRPYHHNSLPAGDFNQHLSPTDSDSVKRGGGANSYHSSKSLPKVRNRNTSQTSKKSQATRTDPHVLAQQLFDRTLERITHSNHSNHSNMEDRRSADRNGGTKALRTNPHQKVASLSTRSSLVYSTDQEMSDTQDISSESDVSLPS